MTTESVPFFIVLICLVVHSFQSGMSRDRLHEMLEVLPEPKRRALGWPEDPGWSMDGTAHTIWRRATARLASWPLPQNIGLPNHIYQAERRFRRDQKVDIGLMVILMACFALMHAQGWIISIAALVFLCALLVWRKKSVGPWPIKCGETT